MKHNHHSTVLKCIKDYIKHKINIQDLKHYKKEQEDVDELIELEELVD